MADEFTKAALYWIKTFNKKAKEKIWMQKLIELLNEYSKNIWYFNEEDLQWQTKAWILSKEFWWVKWLVENDKIDFSKFNFWNEIMYCVYEYTPEVSEEEELLMLLAIQEQPIRFLCEIIK